jgi:hypothetical protein
LVSIRQILVRVAPALALSLTFLPAQTHAPRAVVQIATISPPPANHRFLNDQTLHYGVEWRVFSAGVATLRMEAAGREQRALGTADSTGVVSVLFRVHDRFESFFDPKTFCSRSISKHTEEGRRQLETEITFDSARGKSILAEKNLRQNTSKSEENDIPPCVTDALSAIYYLASLPLNNGMEHRFPLNDGGKTAEVKAIVEEREELKVPAGTFRTVRVQVSANTGPLKDKGTIEVWFSDDAARTPVQIKARRFWGTLVFRLQRVETAK